MHKVKFSVFPNHSFVDLGLCQFGYEACEPGHSFGPARRNHYLFHYVINGIGTLYSNDIHGHTSTFKIHSAGKSPQRFIMNYRMIKAAKMLVMTNKPVNEIGLSVGYENQMHFSRAFRTIYGVSPREWRNTHKADG